MAPKRKQREEREKTVLIGLVELYLITGKPIGSNTLKDNGFDQISSATIRNYFAKLETQGVLAAAAYFRWTDPNPSSLQVLCRIPHQCG